LKEEGGLVSNKIIKALEKLCKVECTNTRKRLIGEREIEEDVVNENLKSTFSS
jgi:hypothetical protein